MAHPSYRLVVHASANRLTLLVGATRCIATTGPAPAKKLARRWRGCLPRVPPSA